MLDIKTANHKTVTVNLQQRWRRFSEVRGAVYSNPQFGSFTKRWEWYVPESATRRFLTWAPVSILAVRIPTKQLLDHPKPYLGSSRQ
jgi:hypothetical protein